MKIKACATVLGLFLLSLAATQLISAQTSEPSASGKLQFSLADGSTRYVEFDARTQADGSIAGQMFLSDDAKIIEQDVDGTGDPNLPNTYPGYYLKADFDGLVVTKNQAVMSGTVRDSSVRDFVGQRVLLTVEDNGKEADKLTWGIYRPVEKGETPTDAERKVDEGAGTRWTTSDAERKDDVEVVYPKETTINARTFEPSAYFDIDVERAAGDIQVRP